MSTFHPIFLKGGLSPSFPTISAQTSKTLWWSYFLLLCSNFSFKTASNVSSMIRSHCRSMANLSMANLQPPPSPRFFSLPMTIAFYRSPGIKESGHPRAEVLGARCRGQNDIFLLRLDRVSDYLPGCKKASIPPTDILRDFLVFMIYSPWTLFFYAIRFPPFLRVGKEKGLYLSVPKASPIFCPLPGSDTQLTKSFTPSHRSILLFWKQIL